MKKTRAKKITEPIKKNFKKDRVSIIKILLKMRNYANAKTRNMSKVDEKL